MTDQQRCFIETLRLTNYRCFADITIPFHPKLNVLVAPNGGGKTALLEGIAAALRLFVDVMEGKEGSKGFDVKDIRWVLNPRNVMDIITPVRLEAKGHFLGTQIAWNRERHSQSTSSRTSTAEAQALRNFAEQLVQDNQAWAQRQRTDPPLFPLISYYGTARLWNTGRLTEIKKGIALNARFRGYTDSLSPSSHYKSFVDWFRRFSYELKRDDSPHNPDQLLAAVGNAVDTVLAPAQWHRIGWDFADDLIVAQHPEYGKLPVDMLSDGIRNIIGLVADIAHRAVLLNPHLGVEAARETPGVVLIDEVDMHLHPSWQQTVLRSLQEAFPLIQFIVTTHSPQVLSTVHKESVRIIRVSGEKEELEIPQYQTRGVESADVLARIMEVDPTPQVEEARRMSDYYALIQQNLFDTVEAKNLRDQLEAHFGKDHPEILEADRMIRLERFKRSLPSRTNQ